MFGVLLDDREDTSSDDPVGSTEVVINFCMFINKRSGCWDVENEPCNVSVIDCSSFSSSSVREKLRAGALL